jgi:hypothetical protein
MLSITLQSVVTFLDKPVKCHCERHANICKEIQKKEISHIREIRLLAAMAHYSNRFF